MRKIPERKSPGRKILWASGPDPARHLNIG